MLQLMPAGRERAAFDTAQEIAALLRGVSTEAEADDRVRTWARSRGFDHPCYGSSVHTVWIGEDVVVKRNYRSHWLSNGNTEPPQHLMPLQLLVWAHPYAREDDRWNRTYVVQPRYFTNNDGVDVPSIKDGGPDCSPWNVGLRDDGTPVQFDW